MKRILLSGIFAGAVFFKVAAQDPATALPAQPTITVKDTASTTQEKPKMTLKEAIKVALDNNLTVKRSVYNVESYKVSLMQAIGAFMPTLNANLSFGRNYGRSVNPVTNSFNVGVIRTINPSATANITLFNGFRIVNNYRATLKNVDASNLDLERTKNDLIINVATYYVTVILNRELYENAKIQLASSQQQLTRIQKQVEAGALSRSNQLNQEAIVATNETNLISQENTLNLSLLQLKQVMQVPASVQFDVVIPDLALEDLVLEQTPEEIYAISAQTLPQIRSALLKVEAAKLAVQSARGSYFPRVTFGASATSNYSSASDRPNQTLNGYTQGLQPIGYDPITNQQIFGLIPILADVPGTGYNEHDQLKNNVYKSLGITISVPILNGLQTRSNVRQSIINYELANITVKENENTLRQSIETAYNNALSSAKTYAAALKQVSASEEAYRITKQRFDNGAANFVEYQISANDLFSAKSTLSRAKYNFVLTKKILDFYQGKSIDY
jgi:outer membrane protein